MSEQPSISSVERTYAELLSLAVHEFRGPAGIISGYMRMLQRYTDSPLTDRQRKMVDEVDKAGARIVALIDEMIQISQLDLNEVSVTEESFDLFTVLEQVASGVHEADDREVRLEVRGEAAGARMKGDLARLRAGFAAFMRVIMREQPSAGTVVVDRRISRAAGRTSALIAIVDEQEVQRSYEVDRIGLEEKKRGGVGLSLPIARRVVERHGGRVWSPVLGPIEPNKAQPAIIVTLPLSEHRR